MHSHTPVARGKSKSEFYSEICSELQALLGEEEDLIANCANTSALLFHSLPDVNWAGFYLANGEDLVLGPFQGKPACVRIRFGKGVCGTAAETGEAVVVPDVNDFPGHIVCDPASRSEIVIPMLTWGRVVGVLDIDSAVPNRFDEDDRDGLESVVAILLAQSGTDMPDLNDEAEEAENEQ